MAIKFVYILYKVFFEVFVVGRNADHGGIVGKKLFRVGKIEGEIELFDGFSDLVSDVNIGEDASA